MNSRVKQDTAIISAQNRAAYEKKMGIKKKSKSKEDKKGKKVKGKYDSEPTSQQMSPNLQRYLPMSVLWMARICLFVIVYLYHV